MRGVTVLALVSLVCSTRGVRVGVVLSSSPARSGQAFAAVLLAQKHFNARDGRVVPAFATLGSCPVTINLTAYDYTYADCGMATRAFIRGSFGAPSPSEAQHAFVGAGHSICSAPLALLGSAGAGLPIVGTSSASPALEGQDLFNMFARPIPSDVVLGRAMAQWIVAHGFRRVGVLHDETPYGSLFSQGLIQALNDLSVSAYLRAFNPHLLTDLERAVRELKEGGEGTPPRVIVSLALDLYLMPMLSLYKQHGMTGAGYLHILSDDVNTALYMDEPLFKEVLDGGAQFFSVGGQPGLPRWDALTAELRTSSWGNFTPVDTSLTGQPIDETALGWSLSDPIHHRTAFAYDALAMIGLGACALAASGGTPTDSSSLLAAMKANAFDGASGRVELAGQSRSAASATIEMTNFKLDRASGELHTATPASRFAAGAWQQLVPFVYGGGSAEPPHDGTQHDCRAGTHLNIDALDCKLCADGYVAPTDGLLECTQCPPGTYASERTQCLECESNSYQPDWAQLECSRCVEHAAYLVHSGDPSFPWFTRRGADNRTDCVCTDGYYAPRGLELGEKCLMCPEGGVCLGTGFADRIVPVPAPGYYARADEPEMFLQCLSESSCPGGGIAVCGHAHYGDMCTLCAEGHFMLHGACIECRPGNRALAGGAAALVGIALAALHLVANPPSTGGRPSRESRARRSSALSFGAELGVVFFFLQTLNLLLGVSVQWPRGMESVMASIAWVNLDLSFFSPQCQYIALAHPITFWRTQALMPVVVVAAFAAVTLLVKWPYAVYTERGATFEAAWRRARAGLYNSVNATVLALTLLYVSSARHILEVRARVFATRWRSPHARRRAPECSAVGCTLHQTTPAAEPSGRAHRTPRRPSPAVRSRTARAPCPPTRRWTVRPMSTQRRSCRWPSRCLRCT